ncbi:MAG: nitroreductase family protein [Candidatus Kapaibacterium sp.]
MLEKRAKTVQPIDDVIAKRWSPRSFDPSKKVSRDQVLSLCEAGRWAPSCFGDEPWRFIVWDRHHDYDKWLKAFNCLGEWNRGWVKNTPILLAAMAGSKFRKNGDFNRWGMYDTGAASENICLQATSMGLMAHQMGGFDKDKLRLEFSIPDRFIPMAMIAVGYQAEPVLLDEEYRKSEIAERFRRPLGHTFFDSEWNKPID